MLIQRCDICDHIIGDEKGYMIEVYEASMQRGTEVRSQTLIASIEICSECKEVIGSALNERLAKYVFIEKERETNK